MNFENLICERAGADGERHPDRQLALVVGLVRVELRAGRITDHPQPVGDAQPPIARERRPSGRVDAVVLEPEIIAELKASKRPSNMAEDEALVYDFVTELTTTQKVSDETYARAKKVFNDQQIVDLTAVSGNYVMVAMLLAMSEETVPPGKEPPFKVGEK